MKQNWEIKKLGEVCDFQGGSQPPKSQFIYESKEGYVRFLQIRDFASDKNITYIPESKKNRYCNEDDILLGRYGASVGKVLVNKAGAYNVAVMKTIPNETILFKRYLFFYLNSGDFQTRLLNTASRSAQDGFSKDDIFDFPILIPPLPEQQRIVSILDEAFSVIERSRNNAEQNLQNAKELFESYLQGVFGGSTGSPTKRDGWEVKKLGEVLVKTETTDPTKNPDTEFTYLDVSSVNKETKEIETPTVLLGKDAPSRAKKLIRTGDVIFATVRPTHSRVALIPEEFDEQVCSTGYFVLRTKESVNNKLVFYFLLTKGFNEQMEKLQKGASYPAVTDNDVKSILFSFPKSKEAQQTIVRQLDALRAETQKLEAVYHKKLEDLEELKKSVLQKAFNGEL